MSWLPRLPFTEPDPHLQEELASFSGEDGTTRVIDTLCGNKAVAGNRKVAETIATKGKLVGFKAGDKIIKQGDSTNSVFFLISGKVDVLTKSSKIADRKAPNQVGEMAAINLGDKRSATVKAASATVIAVELPAADFRELRKGKFLSELSSEMQNRHSQRLELEPKTKSDSIVWVATSVIAAVVCGFACFVIASNLDMGSSERAITSVVMALLAFIAVSLLNPAYFFKRVAAVIALAMLTILAADIQIDLTWAIGSTEYEFRFQRESAQQEPWQTPLNYFMLFCTCALFIWADRKQS